MNDQYKYIKYPALISNLYMYMYLAGNSRGVLDSQGKNAGYFNVCIIVYLFSFFFI